MTECENTTMPGAPEAVARGCKCPVIINHHGKGRDGASEEWFAVEDCPLHKYGGTENPCKYDRQQTTKGKTA